MTDTASAAARPALAGRLRFVDFLNIVASFAVICLHATLNVFGSPTEPFWGRALLMQSCFIFAVPVFFMVSGMNLLGYRRKYSTALFFRKRALRVGGALLFGSVVTYLVLGLFPGQFSPGFPVEALSVRDFAKRLLTNRVNDVYWFLYSIIYLYALTPILSLVAERRRLLWYAIGLTALLTVGFPFIEHLGIVRHEYVGVLFGWPLFENAALLYFLLGYAIRDLLARASLPRWAPAGFLALAVAAAGLTFALAYLDSAGTAKYAPYYAGISSPTGVVLSVSVFCLFASLEAQLRKLPEGLHRHLVAPLSSAALNVYLFHMLVFFWVLAHVDAGQLAFLRANPLLWAVGTYAVTALIAVGIDKASGMRRRAIARLRASREG